MRKVFTSLLGPYTLTPTLNPNPYPKPFMALNPINPTLNLKPFVE